MALNIHAYLLSRVILIMIRNFTRTWPASSSLGLPKRLLRQGYLGELEYNV